jgi:hypothetical protein
MDANVLLKQAQHVYKVVKQKVLNVSPLEALVLECTCNEPWGPHGAALHELAAASRGCASGERDLKSSRWPRSHPAHLDGIHMGQ